MSVHGVTSAARTALAAAITRGGLECRAYDTWDLDQGNIATIGLVRWLINDGSDQQYGFQALLMPVLVYQIIDGSIDQSLGYQETNVENVIDGLAADRTLAGAVPVSDVDGEAVQSFYRTTGGAAYSVVSFDVTIHPFRNVG